MLRISDEQCFPVMIVVNSFYFQICGNENGTQVLLGVPRTLDPYLFSKLMTPEEIRQRIALQPQAPCLNLR